MKMGNHKHYIVYISILIRHLEQMNSKLGSKLGIVALFYYDYLQWFWKILRRNISWLCYWEQIFEKFFHLSCFYQLLSFKKQVQVLTHHSFSKVNSDILLAIRGVEFQRQICLKNSNSIIRPMTLALHLTYQIYLIFDNLSWQVKHK